MLLSALTAHLAAPSIDGPTDRPIERIVFDSREARSADLFVAIRGQRVDARRFVPHLDVAAVIADAPVRAKPGVTVIQVQDARKAMAHVAAALADQPAKNMPVIGITGTNGKTTVSWMLESIITHAGETCGVIGTTGHRIAGKPFSAKHTTPESPVIQNLLGAMRDAKCRTGIMEVSSIGVAMDRVEAIPFRIAIFTSFSRDHLDFHGNMEAYFQAKAQLFERLMDSDGVAILNADEPACKRIQPHTDRVWTYGRSDGATFQAINIDESVNGTEFTIKCTHGDISIELPMVGCHNVSNALAAVAAGCALGFSVEDIAHGLNHLQTIPGRLESVPNKRGITIFVDYAHTPDALENVLQALRRLSPGRVLTVFGCGGDRDPGKRPQMGRAASTGSDHVFITSDNPRSEDPQAIISAILPGVDGPHTIQPDRARAIAEAIHAAQPGDIVLIAGKGHETTQANAGEIIHFDDREVAARAAEMTV
jgi:UDP-N-acetylmuramoyl-L-alanyl-D-glutamate--2,6-diaminopimelate ligase